MAPPCCPVDDPYLPLNYIATQSTSVAKYPLPLVQCPPRCKKMRSLHPLGVGHFPIFLTLCEKWCKKSAVPLGGGRWTPPGTGPGGGEGTICNLTSYIWYTCNPCPTTIGLHCFLKLCNFTNIVRHFFLLEIPCLHAVARRKGRGMGSKCLQN